MLIVTHHSRIVPVSNTQTGIKGSDTDSTTTHLMGLITVQAAMRTITTTLISENTEIKSSPNSSSSFRVFSQAPGSAVSCGM